MLTVVLLTLSTVACDVALGKAELPLPEVTVWGNWCGPEHGGFQDCCSGAQCPNCIIPNGTDVQLSLDNLKACLSECPPVDEEDAACVLHDWCCLNQGDDDPYGCGVFAAAQNCECNCILLRTLMDRGYGGSAIIPFFTNANCWYTNSTGQNVCDGAGGPYTLSFCTNQSAEAIWNDFFAYAQK
jgi:hypothetical protein